MIATALEIVRHVCYIFKNFRTLQPVCSSHTVISRGQNKKFMIHHLYAFFPPVVREKEHFTDDKSGCKIDDTRNVVSTLLHKQVVHQK